MQIWQKIIRKTCEKLLYVILSGNQVDGLPLVLHERLCVKFTKKTYTVDRNFDLEVLVNYQKVASHYIKASIAAIQIQKVSENESQLSAWFFSENENLRDKKRKSPKKLKKSQNKFVTAFCTCPRAETWLTVYRSP